MLKVIFILLLVPQFKANSFIFLVKSGTTAILFSEYGPLPINFSSYGSFIEKEKF